MKLSYTGKVKQSGLHIYNRKQFDEDLNLFIDKEVVLSLENKKRKRSLHQNNFYWGVVIPIVKQGLIDVGYRVTIDDTHDYIKTNFIKKELVNENTGEILPSIGSTTELTTTEFMDLIAEIQQWAAEYLNVEIPDPNEQINIKF